MSQLVTRSPIELLWTAKKTCFEGTYSLHQNRPKKHLKCNTWLESYGSAVSDGKKEKYCFHPVKRQIFGGASGQTSSLILTVCHMRM